MAPDPSKAIFSMGLLSRLSTGPCLAGSAGKLMGMVMCRLIKSIDLTDFIFLLLRGVSVGVLSQQCLIV